MGTWGEVSPSGRNKDYHPSLLINLRQEVKTMEYGLPYLKKKLAAKRRRVLLRYAYYDMKVSVSELSSILPQEFGWLA